MKKILLVEGNLREANQEFTDNGIKTHTESLKESIDYFTNDLEIDSVNPSSDQDIFDKAKDLNKYDSMGYEFETLKEYEKYFGRLIIRFKNKSQTMIRLANSVISDCEVKQILPDRFDNDILPGYENVDISWKDLSRVIEKEVWKTALKNQKGVYLITDITNGKMYVGSAYGGQKIVRNT